jgi:uncharacterized membrane protein (GlpM family)
MASIVTTGAPSTWPADRRASTTCGDAGHPSCAQDEDDLTPTEIAEVAVKTVAGGVLVVVFAVISEAVKPKRFSGIFAAAPAVALAGMIVSGVAKGRHDIHSAAGGMIAGGVAIALYCLTVALLHPRLKALRAALVALPVWLVSAAITYAAIVR